MKKIKNFMEISGQMKDLRRSGWLRKGILEAENDAAHSWSLSMLVQLVAKPPLDVCKCLKMANIHELGEVKVGDFTPFDKITAEEKHRLEAEAILKIAEDLGDPEIFELFQEFEEGKTPEACLVRDLDKLDTVIQAKYYQEHPALPRKYTLKELWRLWRGQRRQEENVFPEFYDYALKVIKSAEAVRLLVKLKD